MLLRFIIFFLGFALVQKLLPVIFPYSSMSVYMRTELLARLIYPADYIFDFCVAAIAYLLIAFPLSRLHWLLSLFFGVLSSTFVGLKFYPYDIYDLGLVSAGVNLCLMIFGAALLLVPWTIFWIAAVKRKRSIGVGRYPAS